MLRMKKVNANALLLTALQQNYDGSAPRIPRQRIVRNRVKSHVEDLMNKVFETIFLI